MKNRPARERPGLRARSSYSDPKREGGAKVPYKYPAWVTEKRDPPPTIMRELNLARSLARKPRDLRAWARSRDEGTYADVA